jgi:hypothetical protein
MSAQARPEAKTMGDLIQDKVSHTASPVVSPLCAGDK